jgi:hypothetical protein
VLSKARSFFFPIGVGNNENRHFYFYIINMEVQILFTSNLNKIQSTLIKIYLDVKNYLIC